MMSVSSKSLTLDLEFQFKETKNTIPYLLNVKIIVFVTIYDVPTPKNDPYTLVNLQSTQNYIRLIF